MRTYLRDAKRFRDTCLRDADDVMTLLQVALVSWTETVGLSLVKRDLHSMTLCTPQTKFIKFTILQIFPFTSETKRMGIIVRVRPIVLQCDSCIMSTKSQLYLRFFFCDCFAIKRVLNPFQNFVTRPLKPEKKLQVHTSCKCKNFQFMFATIMSKIES